MEWIRRNPKAAGALSALAVLCAVVLVWSVTGGSSKATSDSSPLPLLATPTATPSEGLTLTPSPSAGATGTSALGTGGISGSAGDLAMPGLQGGSLYKNLPKHDLEIHVMSEAPIGTVGYVIPTSLHKSSGVNKNVGTEWSLSTTVYGDPDYARVWLQAGARGYPITCVITVDGKQTERRSTDGPYAQLMCQG